jgi:hypothetical protein
VKKILNLWSYRDLTYIGKVTVIKTLALPILVQSLTVLPNPPDSILNDIEQIFYKFLWNGKKDKIKRSIIYHLFFSRDLTIWAGSRRVDYPLTPPFPVSTLINSKKHLSKRG